MLTFFWVRWIGSQEHPGSKEGSNYFDKSVQLMTEQRSPRAEGKHWVKQEADWSVGGVWGLVGVCRKGLEEVVSGDIPVGKKQVGALQRNVARVPPNTLGTLQLDVLRSCLIRRLLEMCVQSLGNQTRDTVEPWDEH